MVQQSQSRTRVQNLNGILAAELSHQVQIIPEWHKLDFRYLNRDPSSLRVFTYLLSNRQKARGREREGESDGESQRGGERGRERGRKRERERERERMMRVTYQTSPTQKIKNEISLSRVDGFCSRPLNQNPLPLPALPPSPSLSLSLFLSLSPSPLCLSPTRGKNPFSAT